MTDILQALADMAEARRAADEVRQEATRKRWRLICGELYMMQRQIIKDRLHTPGTGKNA